LVAACEDLEAAITKAAKASGDEKLTMARLSKKLPERAMTTRAVEAAHLAADACAAHTTAAQLRRSAAMHSAEDEIEEEVDEIEDAEHEAQAAEQAALKAASAAEEAEALSLPDDPGPPLPPPDAVADDNDGGRNGAATPKESSAADDDETRRTNDAFINVATPSSGMHAGSYRVLQVRVLLEAGKPFGVTLARDDRLPTLLLSTKAVGELKGLAALGEGVVTTSATSSAIKPGEQHISLGKGLLVTGVDSSAAAASLVQAGDVIAQIDGTDIDQGQKPSEALKALTAFAEDDDAAGALLERTVTLLIARPSNDDAVIEPKQAKNCSPSCVIS